MPCTVLGRLERAILPAWFSLPESAAVDEIDSSTEGTMGGRSLPV